MNFLQELCSVIIVIMIFCTFFVNLFEKRYPMLGNVLKYGKLHFGTKKIALLYYLEVPKSYFSHIYNVAIFSFGIMFLSTNLAYIFNKPPPEWVLQLLGNTCGVNRIASVSATKTYIASILMTLHVFRRFYESHFVSVFSKNSRWSIFHYSLGISFYLIAPIAIVCEAPAFGTQSFHVNSHLNFSELSFVDFGAVVVFVWVFWHQHVITTILGNLRKNKQGKVVTEEYRLPYGDWFEYLTAPHLTAEVLMYSSITILLWKNFTWLLVFIFVVVNQVELMLLNHWWCQKIFPNYPKKRKALIPFLY